MKNELEPLINQLIDKRLQAITLLADKKFSQLPNASTPYDGTEEWVGLQDGANVKGSFPYIVSGTYTPTVNIVSGLSNVAIVMDTDGITPVTQFFGIADPGGRIITAVKLTATTNGSGAQCQFTLTNPVSTTFSMVGQAQILGFPSIVKTPGGTGNTGGGWNGNLTADLSTNGVLFAFEASEINTQYHIDLAWIYKKL